MTNATDGKVDFELDISKDHTNRLKIIHGGTIASMVDLGGSLAVASKGLYATGVSTDLNGMLFWCTLAGQENYNPWCCAPV